MCTMTDQIDFVCVRADHQISTLVEALTMHEEKWAYCPSARIDGHDWQPCDATGLEDLRTMLQVVPAAQITASGHDGGLIHPAPLSE
jgi:hypothetical protein